MKFILLDKNTEIEINNSEDVVLLGFNNTISSVILNIDKNISINIYALFILNGDSKVSLKTNSNHLQFESKSRVLIKTVLNGKSEFDYNGMIHIANHAVNSDAYLQNENLVLSDDVIVNSSPQLKIENNLVKASHGVVTSTVNSAKLEYLMSRGLSKKDATVLIVNGFIGDIVSMLPENLYEQVQKRLSDFF